MTRHSQKVAIATAMFAAAFAQAAPPLQSPNFSVAQRINVPARLQTNDQIQVPIFASSYNILVPLGQSVTINIDSDFKTVCQVKNINFTSSDPEVITVINNGDVIKLISNSSGIKNNWSALITARCGRFTDSIVARTS